MRTRTNLTIVTLVGLGALLIAALAVIIAPRSQIAYAQNPQPSVHIDLNNVFGNATYGQTLAFYTFKNFQSITCDKNVGGPHHTTFDDVCYYRAEIYDRSTNSRNKACEDGLGGNRSFQKDDGIERKRDSGALSSSCPTGGQYILKVILMGSDKVEVASAIEYFGVNVNPDPTPIVTNTPTRTPTSTRQSQPQQQHQQQQPTPTPTATPTGDTQEPPPLGGNNQPTATPTATPTIDPDAPTATPTATPTRDPDAPTATPTATPTRDPLQPPPLDDSNQGNNNQGGNQGNQGGNQGSQQGNNGGNQGGNQGNQQGNNGGNNQGRSNNQGSNNQGGYNQGGGVPVKSFISNPTPLPSYAPQQYQAPIAITIPEIMNVRSGPGLTYDIVTTVPAGTQGTIVGIDPDNDWYQVEIVGIAGRVWIYRGLTTLQGSLTGVKQYTALEVTQLTTGTPVADGSVPLAITIPELMNVRTGPGLIYNIVTTVPAGTQGYIYGIDPENEWYHVQIDGIVGQVWIYQDLTTLVGSLVAVKQYTALEIAQLLSGGSPGAAPLAITVPITMNVRTGPGLLYDIVSIVPKGTQGHIFGIDPDNDWFQVELEGLDTLIWLYQDLTTVVGSLAGVKWVTEAELALLPAAITQPLLLNARAGPGLTYDILTTIPQGTWMKITGIDTLGEWYRVELADFNQQAWIFRDYTKVAGGSLSGLIQLALGDAPPAAGQLTSSITVDLSLPPAGGVNLDVNWVDVSGCAQFYNLYHRASTDTTVYISLDQAATASTVNSKSLSFSTLSGSSFISAWCGSMAAGREVAEVEIDPGVAGTYSSTMPVRGGIASVPPRPEVSPR